MNRSTSKQSFENVPIESELLQSIWESTTEYSLVAEDLNGIIIAWNEGARRFYGYEASEIIGQSSFILHDPKDVKSGKTQAILDDVAENGKWAGNVNRVRKNGMKFIAYVTITLRYDREHNFIGYTMISRDATKSIKKLKDSQASVKTAQDNLEISKNSLKSSRDDFKISEHDLKSSQIDLKESQIENFDLIQKIKIQNKKLITINKELVEQNYRTKEATRLKSEFLANMSHELRTPLNGIIGFSDLMRSGRAGPVSSDFKEYLGDVLISARHLLRLVSDVLDLSKVEAGKMEFRPEPVNIENTVKEVCNILRTLITKKRINLEIIIDPLLDNVIIDPARFKQLLYNFISNAIKFTPFDHKITVQAFSVDLSNFRLEVIDTGIGIRTEDLAKLFVEFSQIDASMSKNYAGTGLGLALSRQMVEAQGGTIGVNSVFGEGSCFFAILPKIPNVSQAKNKKHETKKSRNLPSKKARATSINISFPTILIIEDDPDDRHNIVKILANSVCGVQIAKNGKEAIKLVHKQKFNAITLDLILPDMSGFDILRVIRSEGLNQDTPVFVVSVVAEKPASLGYHIHDFLIKPVLADELLSSFKIAGILPDEKNSKPLIAQKPLE